MFNGLEPDGAAIAQEVDNEHGIKHLFSPANMMDPAAIRAMVTEALDVFGRIEVAIYNAGIQHVAAVETFLEAT